jgi:hypothetical protein
MLDALGVQVQAGRHVVDRRDHASEGMVEAHVKDLLALRTHAQRICPYVGLRVHLLHCLRGNLRFGFLNKKAALRLLPPHLWGGRGKVRRCVWGGRGTGG